MQTRGLRKELRRAEPVHSPVKLKAWQLFKVTWEILDMYEFPNYGICTESWSSNTLVRKWVSACVEGGGVVGGAQDIVSRAYWGGTLRSSCFSAALNGDVVLRRTMLWIRSPPLSILPNICFAFAPHARHTGRVRGGSSEEGGTHLNQSHHQPLSLTPACRPPHSPPFSCLMWP